MKPMQILPISRRSTRSSGAHRFASYAAMAIALLAMLLASAALANPWVPIANPVQFAPGNGLPGPQEVPGKDFSDVRDRDELAADDSEQVVAWDGSGGVRDSFDYNGSRALYPPDSQVDALASGTDALFHSLRDNRSALLFSVSDDANIMYVRPTGLPNATAGFGVWATPTDIDALNPPLDVDGLEVWGGDQLDDSNRYSLADDPPAQLPAAPQRVSIWDYDSNLHTSNPHTFTSDLAAAIDLQFGGIGVGGEIWSRSN